MGVVDYLTDPILRAPTIGSMLMCFAASLIGVVAFLRKSALVGEALSHACYPGVVLSALFAGLFFPNTEGAMAFFVLVGALLFSLLGLVALHQLQTRFKVSSDAALCLVLSLFLGVGVLIASRVQSSHALWYRQIQAYLYGQAATMTDLHIFIYGALALIVLLAFLLCYRPLQMLSFDRGFAASLGVKTALLDGVFYFLLALAVVVGIRSVGVVLMSGMLIAPAVAARQLTQKLSLFFTLAGVCGAVSGFLGNYLSVELPRLFSAQLSLPTGPMILLSASALAFTSLLLAPRRGLLSRFLRIARFRNRCHLENILKAHWKKAEKGALSLKSIAASQGGGCWLIRWRLRRLIWQGWMEKRSGGRYGLSRDGRKKAEQIVRLHRLWEVYLVYLGNQADKVHTSAEEMEHILTPELERQLVQLLHNPTVDPHAQPIPGGERLP